MDHQIANTYPGSHHATDPHRNLAKVGNNFHDCHPVHIFTVYEAEYKIGSTFKHILNTWNNWHYIDGLIIVVI